MMTSTSSNWQQRTFHSDSLDLKEVLDRQDRIPGFSSGALAQSHVLLIGAGGLGGQVAGGLVRKGTGRLTICDPDVVEESNLNRQAFYRRDLHQPKAVRLAQNAALEGHSGSIVIGHYVAFRRESAARLCKGVSLAICGVDNNQTRAFASQYLRSRGIPCVFCSVNESADYAWIFAQEQSGACLGCVFPRIAAASDARRRCRAVPAVLDILQLSGAVVLYVCDSLLMQRQRRWNFRDFHFVGGAADLAVSVPVRSGCELCGGE